MGSMQRNVLMNSKQNNKPYPNKYNNPWVPKGKEFTENHSEEALKGFMKKSKRGRKKGS